MTSLDHNTPIPTKSLAEIQERNERALRRAEDPAWSLDQAELDRAMLCAEVERLNSYFDKIDRLNEVADADWKREVDRLKAALANEEATTDRLVGERDDMEKLLDKFAYAIAPEEVIGEHSSGNDPWQNALDLLTPADKVDRLTSERDKASEAAKHMGAALEKAGTAMQISVATSLEFGNAAGMDIIIGYLSDAGLLPSPPSDEEIHARFEAAHEESSQPVPDGGDTR